MVQFNNLPALSFSSIDRSASSNPKKKQVPPAPHSPARSLQSMEIFRTKEEESTTTSNSQHTPAPPCTSKGMKKKLKLTHWGEEEEEDSTKGDLISGLPDDVLTSILSLVPMKDAMKTSILSTTWRFQWASRPNLEFDINTILGRSIPRNSIRNEKALQLVNSEYVGRVGKLLQLYRAPRVYSFKVSYCTDQVSSCQLDQWIKFAIAMEVEILEINLSAQPYLSYRFRSRYTHYNFPCLLLSSHDGKPSSLKHLRLGFSTLVCPSNFNGFNTLVTLDLHEVELNESCLDSFFSSCLLLEILNMRSCKLPTNLNAVGPCVNLKCLEIIECLGVKKIFISASKLSSFRYCGGIVSFSLSNLPWLKSLFIETEVCYKPCVLTQLPKDLPRLESLYLSLITEMNDVPAKVASFSNLKQLEIQMFSCPDVMWIISTINVLPRLVKLTLMFSFFSKGKLSIRASGCPNNHLKEVVIYCFEPSNQIQMDLVFYLLKNCVALERMIVSTHFAIYTLAGKFTFVEQSELEPTLQEGEKEKLHEVLHREVPDRAELVTIIERD